MTNPKVSKEEILATFADAINEKYVKGDRGDIGLDGREVLKVQEAHPTGSDVREGDLHYKPSSKKLFLFDGESWVEIAKRGEMGLEGVSGKDGKDSKVAGPRGAKGERGASGKDADLSEVKSIAGVEAKEEVSGHLKKHDHTLIHDPFILGTKKISEKDIGDGKFIQYNEKKGELVYSTIKDMAQRLEPFQVGRGFALPAQTGNSGKYLTTDGSDPSWGTVNGLATDTLWDAKGDLAVGTGANTASVLTVGANDTVLTADSTTATGTKWAAVNGMAIGTTVTSATAGSVLFAGTAGVLAQDNANFKWDHTNAAATQQLLIQSGIATNRGLVVKGFASQTANLQEWQNSAGTLRGSITKDGVLVLNADGGTVTTALKVDFGGVNYWNVGTNLTNANSTFYVDQNGVINLGGGYIHYGVSSAIAYISTYNELQMQPGALGGTGTRRISIISQAAADMPFAVKGAAAQTANLTEWQNSAGTVLTSVASSGLITIPLSTTAPMIVGAGITDTGFGLYSTSNVAVWVSGVMSTVWSTNNDMRFRSGGIFGWSSALDNIGAADTGLARNAADVVEINNGTKGTFRDLKARNATLTGIVASTMTSVTIAASATTFAATSNVVKVTGDAGLNIVATITGGVSGQMLTLIFVDALITITDTAAATANTVDLSAAFVSSANDTLTLVYDGNKFFEVSRSVN